MRPKKYCFVHTHFKKLEIVHKITVYWEKAGQNSIFPIVNIQSKKSFNEFNKFLYPLLAGSHWKQASLSFSFSLSLSLFVCLSVSIYVSIYHCKEYIASISCKLYRPKNLLIRGDLRTRNNNCIWILMLESQQLLKEWIISPIHYYDMKGLSLYEIHKVMVEILKRDSPSYMV